MKRQRYNKATITFCIAGSRKKWEMKSVGGSPPR